MDLKGKEEEGEGEGSLNGSGGLSAVAPSRAAPRRPVCGMEGRGAGGGLWVWRGEEYKRRCSVGASAKEKEMRNGSRAERRLDASVRQMNGEKRRGSAVRTRAGMGGVEDAWVRGAEKVPTACGGGRGMRPFGRQEANTKGGKRKTGSRPPPSLRFTPSEQGQVGRGWACGWWVGRRGRGAPSGRKRRGREAELSKQQTQKMSVAGCDGIWAGHRVAPKKARVGGRACMGACVRVRADEGAVGRGRRCTSKAWVGGG